MVVNTGAKLVLIDTGNGPGSRQTGTGRLPDNCRRWHRPEEYRRGDHLAFPRRPHQRLRTADGALAFPNAEIMVPAKEWAFWSDEGAASRAPQGQQATFQNTKRIFGPIADKMTKYEWGKELVPGITARDTNGHTPGHTSFLIASGSGSVLYQADVTAGYAPLQFHNPSWLVGGDMDGNQAVETRRKLTISLRRTR